MKVKQRAGRGGGKTVKVCGEMATKRNKRAEKGRYQKSVEGVWSQPDTT